MRHKIIGRNSWSVKQVDELFDDKLSRKSWTSNLAILTNRGPLSLQCVIVIMWLCHALAALTSFFIACAKDSGQWLGAAIFCCSQLRQESNFSFVLRRSMAKNKFYRTSSFPIRKFRSCGPKTENFDKCALAERQVETQVGPKCLRLLRSRALRTCWCLSWNQKLVTQRWIANFACGKSWSWCA